MLAALRKHLIKLRAPRGTLHIQRSVAPAEIEVRGGVGPESWGRPLVLRLEHANVKRAVLIPA